VLIQKLLRTAIPLILVLVAANAWAVSGSLWETQSKDDFEAGEPDGVSILPDGKAVLGPRVSATRLDALFVWTLEGDSKGNIYAGTGNDGKIFKISPKADPDFFADLELQQVFALVADDKDMLYAGGFPGGKIYSINSRGEVSEYFDTGQNSVWALCVGKDGVLFASTGDEGQIFRIEAGGNGRLLYDSPERRILSLLCAPDGYLYAGSEQNGLIYRIDQDGHPFVLYDTELEEVISMTMDDFGNLYAVSSPGDLFARIPPPVAPAAPRGAMGGNGGPTPASSKAAMAGPGMPAIPSQKKRTCIIYKITQEGIASKLWESPEKLIFAIEFDGTNILAGSGDEGVIYIISPTGEAGCYYKADQKQVLDLYRTSQGRMIGAAGNVAAVMLFDGGYASEGAFYSRVHDATTLSNLGRVFWDADMPRQTGILVSTRTGNSEVPDDTWSEWSGEGDDADGFVSESPGARYIQWRARLSTSNADKTPLLRKVTVAYLQNNLAPTVESLIVDNGADTKNQGAQPGNAAKNMGGMAPGAMPPGAKPKPGSRRASKEGLKPSVPTHTTEFKVQWQANDENDDKLEYELYFKGTDESNWKLLERELTDSSFKWDTEAVPDGEYHLRIVASDLPDNPEGTSLVGERTSEPFVIDNTAPTVGSFETKPARSAKDRVRITCGVSDNLSPLRSAHYSIDAGDWRALTPVDGIFDSPDERMEFITGALERGEHTVVLKAVDYFGNIGSGKSIFRVR
jgi:hypothetical protein